MIQIILTIRLNYYILGIYLFNYNRIENFHEVFFIIL